jgi:hypothetical protein
MWKPALAGAVLLAAGMTSLAGTVVRAEEYAHVQRQSLQAGTVISNAQISRFKAALRLTAEQERHWPAVAAALRSMRLGNRMVEVAANAFGVRRLVSAARPLFESLNDDQKLVALRLVESLGFGAFVAAL